MYYLTIFLLRMANNLKETQVEFFKKKSKHLLRSGVRAWVPYMCIIIMGSLCIILWLLVDQG